MGACAFQCVRTSVVRKQPRSARAAPAPHLRSRHRTRNVRHHIVEGRGAADVVRHDHFIDCRRAEEFDEGGAHKFAERSQTLHRWSREPGAMRTRGAIRTGGHTGGPAHAHRPHVVAQNVRRAVAGHANDRHLLTRGKRQNTTVVLQQHHGLQQRTTAKQHACAYTLNPVQPQRNGKHGEQAARPCFSPAGQPPDLTQREPLTPPRWC
jgi:hypothetical protein